MKSLKEQGFYYGALLYTFLMPFPQKIATIALILWSLLSILSFDKSTIEKNRLLWLLPLLFATYPIGLFTSGTVYYGFLETKLSFLIFPLIFFLHKYTVDKRENILKALVFGVVLSGVVCLLYASYRSLSFEAGTLIFSPNVLEEKGLVESILYGGNYYFGSFFSIFHQTVYYALYISAALAVVLFRSNLFNKRLLPLLVLFFFLLLFLISNKAAIIAIGLVLFIRLFTAKMSLGKKWVSVLFLGVVIAIFIRMNPRADESLRIVVDTGLTIDKNARYGFSTRLLSWDATIDLIKEKPILGHGAGDAQKRLNESYEAKGYTFPLKEEYNAHNLWLQTWMENGLLGISALAILFFTLFKTGLRDYSFWGFTLSLVVLLFVNSLFESMFHRFSGISFFSYLACYVVTVSRRREALQ